MAPRRRNHGWSKKKKPRHRNYISLHPAPPRISHRNDARYEEIFSNVLENVFLIPTCAESSKYFPNSREPGVLVPSDFWAAVKCEEVDDDKTRVEDKLNKYECVCGRLYDKHVQLHQHIVFEHERSELVCCIECGVTAKAVCNNNVCHICGIFALRMDEHQRMHYQDRTSNGALMECRKCYRNFPTVKEVIEHEKMHGKKKGEKRLAPTWKCLSCDLEFLSQHLRDQHILTHFSHVMHDVWNKLEAMQCTEMVNECPLCACVTSSRKSFRLHIVHKHLLQDPQAFITEMNISLELSVPLKTAIKEEVKDSSYECVDVTV